MAITGEILVTPNELRSQAGLVKSHLSQMQSSFEELESQMHATEAFWIGEAGDTHRQLYSAKLQKIEEILARYKEQVTDLEMMAGVYDEAEAKAVNAAETLPLSQLD